MTDPAAARLSARLKSVFREELQDNLGVLAEGLRELEDPTGRGATPALVQDLFRAAHSLKGAAHSAGVTEAVRPCSRLEESLAAVRSGEVTVDEELLAVVAREVAALAEVRERLNTVAASASPAPARRSANMHPALQPAESRARVAVRSLDDLMHQTATLSSVTDQLGVLTEYLGILQETTQGPLGEIISDFNNLGRALGRAVGQLSMTAQRLRMEPVGDLTTGIDHVVRELCRVTGKRARLVVDGGDVELDRDVADSIHEPLLHLVRNAVDHGIETPEQRVAADKSPDGTVRVSAVLDGARVCITVADDGAGLDVTSLRAAAGRDGIGADAAELAFRPGVSTATSVTDVSGRGVGLDAVRVRVESLGGSVRLVTDPGQGTEAVVHVPTSLAVMRLILVRAGAELVALPVAALERLHRALPGQVHSVDGQLSVTTKQGESRPAVHLGAALGFGDENSAGRSTTVVELAGDATTLLVDAVESDREALLQPLPARVRGNGMVLGAVLLPQDRVALVVNPSTCVRQGRVL